MICTDPNCLFLGAMFWAFVSACRPLSTQHWVLCLGASAVVCAGVGARGIPQTRHHQKNDGLPQSRLSKQMASLQAHFTSLHKPPLIPTAQADPAARGAFRQTRAKEKGISKPTRAGGSKAEGEAAICLLPYTNFLLKPFCIPIPSRSIFLTPRDPRLAGSLSTLKHDGNMVQCLE